MEDIVQAEIINPAIQMQGCVYETVKNNMQASRDKIKEKKQASRTATHTFVPGEKVLSRNIRSQQRKGGKLDRDFLGPFTITSIKGKSADLINENGVSFSKNYFDGSICGRGISNSSQAQRVSQSTI